MASLSKSLVPAVCFSLFASSASAAIPDANGAIHGCYNVLTGATRIIDGTSCSLLEKPITWQQTGPRGPTGATGPQGPQGATGSSGVQIGTNGLTIPISPTGEPVFVFNEFWTYAPAKDAYCNVTVSATVITSDETATNVRVAPVMRYLGNNGFAYPQGDEALLHSAPNFTSSGTVDPYRGTYQQGSTTFGFNVAAGTSYVFGVRMTTQAPLWSQAFARANITWVCQENDSNPSAPVSSPRL